MLDQLERDLGKLVYLCAGIRTAAYEVMGVDPKIMHCGSLLRKLSEPGPEEASEEVAFGILLSKQGEIHRKENDRRRFVA